MRGSPQYSYTCHRNLRCFPQCSSPTHRQQGFCGGPIKTFLVDQNYAVPHSDLLLFGEIRSVANEPLFQQGQVKVLPTSTDIKPGWMKKLINGEFVGSSAEDGRRKMWFESRGKWHLEQTRSINNSCVFTVYVVRSDGMCVVTASGPVFQMNAVWRSPISRPTQNARAKMPVIGRLKSSSAAAMRGRAILLPEKSATVKNNKRPKTEPITKIESIVRMERSANTDISSSSKLAKPSCAVGDGHNLAVNLPMCAIMPMQVPQHERLQMFAPHYHPMPAQQSPYQPMYVMYPYSYPSYPPGGQFVITQGIYKPSANLPAGPPAVAYALLPASQQGVKIGFKPSQQS